MAGKKIPSFVSVFSSVAVCKEKRERLGLGSNAIDNLQVATLILAL